MDGSVEMDYHQETTILRSTVEGNGMPGLGAVSEGVSQTVATRTRCKARARATQQWRGARRKRRCRKRNCRGIGNSDLPRSFPSLPPQLHILYGHESPCRLQAQAISISQVESGQTVIDNE